MSMDTFHVRTLACGLLCGLLALGSAAHAQSGELQRLSEQAARGDAKAQTALGNRYHDGWGVQKDIAQALEWYRRAAAQGYAEGQFRLGNEHATGHGVPVDAGKAIELFTQAAQQGHAQAQYRLGKYYHEGKHVPQDLEKTIHWYSAAADNGWPAAQFMMATHRLALGEHAQALALFELAAPSHPEAGAYAALMHFAGQGTPVDYVKAGHFASRAAPKDMTAQALYGHLLMQGKGVAKDPDQARKHLSEAANQGQGDAMFWLAEAMEAGTVVSPGAEMAAAYNNTSTRELMRDEALQWYEKAAAAGQQDAQQRLRERQR